VGEDNVYRTDEDGTIEFITDGQTLWVKAQTARKFIQEPGRL